MIADESSPAVKECESGLGFSGRWSREDDTFLTPEFNPGVEGCGFNVDVDGVCDGVK
jgi:hypothetical protein